MSKHTMKAMDAAMQAAFEALNKPTRRPITDPVRYAPDENGEMQIVSKDFTPHYISDEDFDPVVNALDELRERLSEVKR